MPAENTQYKTFQEYPFLFVKNILFLRGPFSIILEKQYRPPQCKMLISWHGKHTFATIL